MSDETCGNCKHSVKHWTPDRYVCMRASDAVSLVDGDRGACSDFDPLTYGGLSVICEAFGHALVLGVQCASAERTCRMNHVLLYDEEGVEGIECDECGWEDVHGWDEPMPERCPGCSRKVVG